MKNNLIEIFLKKYSDRTLAQVYLLRYQSLPIKEEWLKSFFKRITPLNDHPDILWVTRDPKEEEYKVDSSSIKALTQFLNFKSFALSKKFIIIEDAHLLSVIVSNKLLKILEELPEHFCLFLMVPADESLLATVEGRAIKIRLHGALDFLETNQSNSINLQFLGPQEFLLELKKSDSPHVMEKIFIEESLRRTMAKKNFSACEEALLHLKNHRESERFNNSKAARLSPFFSS